MWRVCLYSIKYLAVVVGSPVCGPWLKTPPEDTNFGKYRGVRTTKRLNCEVIGFAHPVLSSFKILPTKYKRQEPSHVGGIGDCVSASKEGSVGNHQSLTVGNPVTEERVNEERVNAMAKSVSKIRDVV